MFSILDIYVDNFDRNKKYWYLYNVNYKKIIK